MFEKMPLITDVSFSIKLRENWKSETQDVNLCIRPKQFEKPYRTYNECLKWVQN